MITIYNIPVDAISACERHSWWLARQKERGTPYTPKWCVPKMPVSAFVTWLTDTPRAVLVKLFHTTPQQWPKSLQREQACFRSLRKHFFDATMDEQAFRDVESVGFFAIWSEAILTKRTLMRRRELNRRIKLFNQSERIAVAVDGL
jgi:hypothetical protein